MSQSDDHSGGRFGVRGGAIGVVQAVRNLPVLVFGLDAEGRFSVVEGQRLARKGDSLVGKDASGVFKGYPTLIDGVGRALDGERIHLVVDLDGRRFGVWLNPLMDEEGGVVGVSGVAVLVPPHSQTDEDGITSAERMAPTREARRAPTVKKKRLLVVEDNPVTRRVLQRMLESDYDVVSTAGVDEALAAARAAPLDVALLDINLNERRTGVEVLHALRRMPGYRSLPAVACTAYVLPEMYDRFAMAGFSGFVGKPFTKEQLLGVLARSFDREVVEGLIDTQLENADLNLPPLSPTLPSVMRLVKGSFDDAAPDVLVGILERDPVVSAWVLKHVNANFENLRARVASIERAVTLLGAETVCNLVVSELLGHSFGGFHTPASEAVYEVLVKTSLATAAFGRGLARRLSLADPDVVYTAGMLHQLGRYGLLSGAVQKYAGLWTDRKAAGVGRLMAPTIGQELLNFGTDHISLGVEIGKRWSLSRELLVAIRYYQEPQRVHLSGMRPVALCVGAAREGVRLLYPDISYRAAWMYEGQLVIEALGEEALITPDAVRQHLEALTEPVHKYVENILHPPQLG